MTNIDVLGFTSVFFTTISFVPQAVLVRKTWETGTLSLTMYSIFNLAVACWLAYGIWIEDSALIIANMITPKINIKLQPSETWDYLITFELAFDL